MLDRIADGLACGRVRGLWIWEEVILGATFECDLGEVGAATLLLLDTLLLCASGRGVLARVDVKVIPAPLGDDLFSQCIPAGSVSGGRFALVPIPYADAAVDVDNDLSYDMVSEVLRERAAAKN